MTPTQPPTPSQEAREAARIVSETFAGSYEKAVEYRALVIQSYLDKATEGLRSQLAVANHGQAACPYCRGEIGVILTTVGDQGLLHSRLTALQSWSGAAKDALEMFGCCVFPLGKMNHGCEAFAKRTALLSYFPAEDAKEGERKH